MDTKIDWNDKDDRAAYIKEYQKTQKGKESSYNRNKRYLETEKGKNKRKDSSKRWNESEKGRAAVARRKEKNLRNRIEKLTEKLRNMTENREHK